MEHSTDIIYGTWYLKLFDDNKRNIVLKAFVPIDTTYPFTNPVSNGNQDLFNNIPGKWIEINELAVQGWKLQQAIPRYTDWVGIFKKSLVEQSYEEKTHQILSSSSSSNESIDHPTLEEKEDSSIKVYQALNSFINYEDGVLLSMFPPLEIVNEIKTKTEIEVLQWLNLQIKK